VIADLTLTIPDFWLGVMAGIGIAIAVIVIAGIVVSGAKS
jgi:hypothetical protein